MARTSGEPKYMTISRHLKNAIRAGAYPPGAKLPSESELCRDYGVQRDTARRALNLLVQEGLIVKHPGRGSFVKSRTDKITLEVDPAIAEFLRRIAKEQS